MTANNEADKATTKRQNPSTDMNRNDYYFTKTELSNRTGWTRTMVKILADPPDKEKPHHRFRDTTVKLYMKHRISDIEGTDSFKMLSAEARRRSELAEERKIKKKAKLHNLAEDLKFTTSFQPYAKIRKRVDQGYAQKEKRNEPSSTAQRENDVKRLMVEYILTKLTNYSELRKKHGLDFGDRTARDIFKRRILDSIAKEYPNLKNACSNAAVGLYKRPPSARSFS